MPADAMDQTLLEACDARANARGAYERPIAAAVEALTGMGVFSPEEFGDVKIGFCALRAAGGPLATTSCAGDIILIDDQYAARNEALPLKATLAHEMRHVLQHREQKALHGAAYCEGALYEADKPRFEAQADRFGAAVATLFFSGRAVEIRNRCDAAVTVYLEAQRPASAAGAALESVSIEANSKARAALRALSGRFNVAARTNDESAPQPETIADGKVRRRIVDGRTRYLTEATLASEDRATGPFFLTLSCP